MKIEEAFERSVRRYYEGKFTLSKYDAPFTYPTDFFDELENGGGKKDKKNG